MTAPWQGLQAQVSGTVVTPPDAAYGAVTATWDRALPARSPIALAAASTADIATGARWAVEHGLGVSLVNTGHSTFSSHENALFISSAGLRTVRLDPQRRRARVSPGARWSDVAAAALSHGLVGAEGSAPGVGVIGYTLGGGLGPLGRTLGFASDRVTQLTVLDSKFRPMRVDARDGDLFWALRGAGPLGLVTELEFTLEPLSLLFGGGVYFDGADAEKVLLAYAAWVEEHDRRTTTSIALLHLPPSPGFPAEIRGRFVVHLRVAHVDPNTPDLGAAGAALMAPMIHSAGVILDTTSVMPTSAIPNIHRDPVVPQSVEHRSGFLSLLDALAVRSIVESMSPNLPATPRMLELRHLGGAYTPTGETTPSAVTGAREQFNVYVTAACDPEGRGRRLVDESIRLIAPGSRGNLAQFNFYGPSPVPGSILELWTEADAQRVSDVGRVLDPESTLRTGRPYR